MGIVIGCVSRMRLGPQLYALSAMNSLSVFKFIIPTLKNKLTHSHSDHSPLFGFAQRAPLSNLALSFEHLLPNMASPLADPLRLPLDPEAKEEEEEETCKSTCSLPHSEHHLQKNVMGTRVRSLQYEANSPCEDALVWSQLRSVEAYAVSVFDGHGGAELAEYCRSRLHGLLERFLGERARQFVSAGEAIKAALRWSYREAEEAFAECYEQQLRLGNRRIRSVGTCAITAVVHNDALYLANAGDSQAVLLLSDSRGITTAQSANQRLSVNSASERDRLRKMWPNDEGIVAEEGGAYYLKGRLQPTRTLGDYYLKKEQHFQGPGEFQGPYLSCDPDVTEHQLTPSHRYLVVASDGVWDALSKSQVTEALLTDPQIDLTKTRYDLEEEEEPPYLNSVLNAVLERASHLSGLSLPELKALPPGQRRNYHDDITLAVVDLRLQSN